jgi:Holliday junction resolvasome RuvABC ATP-dependent DNA helicase subunit
MRKQAKFHDFIGQRRLLEPIRSQQAGAMALNEPLAHLMITGVSGSSKTTLARALARECGTKLRKVMGYEPGTC